VLRLPEPNPTGNVLTVKYLVARPNSAPEVQSENIQSRRAPFLPAGSVQLSTSTTSPLHKANQEDVHGR
jgi:hypothetical protein